MRITYRGREGGREGGRERGSSESQLARWAVGRGEEREINSSAVVAKTTVTWCRINTERKRAAILPVIDVSREKSHISEIFNRGPTPSL